jgi:sugar phosphate isomerase/epimerase
MKRISVIVLVLTLKGTLFFGQELDNVFYAFHNCVRTLNNTPVGAEAQARLIKELGYDGLSGHHQEDYFIQRRAMDKVDLAMPEIYLPATIHADGTVTFKKGIRDIIKDSKDRDLIVALAIFSDPFKENTEEGDIYLVEAIRELADFALPYGAKIAVYPHLDFYCERLDHSLKICKEADRPNVGAIFNTCHLFKVEGTEGWEQKLRDAVPHLFMISINGLDNGDTQNMNWDRLIQPLDEGTFDTYRIVKIAKDQGYTGPFGLQCYNIKEDCEVALRRSMKTWMEYKERCTLD